MRATVEFELPEEEAAHLRAVKAWDMYMCLHELEEWVRRQAKDKDTITTEELRTHFFAALGDNFIDLQELAGNYSGDRG